MPRSTRRLGSPALVALFLFAIAVASAIVLAPSAAIARPGGGQAFGSGGGGPGAASGAGGIGHSTSGTDASFAPSTLSANATMGLVAIALGIVGVFVLVSGSSAKSTEPASPPRPPSPRADGDDGGDRGARARLRDLARYDAAFSVPIFEDFASALYTEIALAAGRDELARMRAYVSEEAMTSLARRPLAGVTTVLVGALRIRDVSKLDGPSDKVSVELEFEANLARRDAATGVEEAVYVCERWVLRRTKAQRSRRPDRARVLACPSCSGPLESLLAGRCRYCANDVATGAFDWVLCSVRVVRARERGPVLTSGARDTDLRASSAEPEARTAFDTSIARGDDGAYRSFVERVETVFATFHEAWSVRDLEPMRPLTSDALFEAQSYWIREYRKQGLRNVTEDAEISRIEVARIATDAYFDAVTVRIHASAKDYIVDDEGAVVSGEPKQKTRYSEYWTFLRKKPLDDANERTDCPRCGAPLATDVRGHCAHCEAKVTNRATDWVLSRIDQDEAYGG